jgi:hypothetical protein
MVGADENNKIVENIDGVETQTNLNKKYFNTHISMKN